MTRLIVCGVLVLAPMTAQEARPRSVFRVVEVKNADVRQLGELVSIQGGPAVRWNEHFRTISLSGPEQGVTEAEELIRRFDTPRPAARLTARNFEVVAYLINSAVKGTGGEALPAELDTVAKQLRQSYGPCELRLVESIVLRLREGERGESSGNAPFGSGGQTPTGRYGLRIGRTGLTVLEKSNVIRLDEFRFSIQAPYQVSSGGYQYADIGFNTFLDVREGQKVIVGKAKYDGADNALILVLAAKAVD